MAAVQAVPVFLRRLSADGWASAVRNFGSATAAGVGNFLASLSTDESDAWWALIIFEVPLGRRSFIDDVIAAQEARAAANAQNAQAIVNRVGSVIRITEEGTLKP